MLPRETHFKCKGGTGMKKDSIVAVKVPKPRHRKRAKERPRVSPRRGGSGAPQRTIGLDLGDKTCRYCALDAAGEVEWERSVATTKKAMRQAFGRIGPCRIALEVGTHSPWVSRLLGELGHEVIVANARRVRLITESSRKDDRMDAQLLARLARVDPGLLSPIRHRGERAQQHLARIKARAALVEGRTALVNTARGLTKSTGERLPSGDADHMGVPKLEGLPAELQATLRPLLEVVETLTKKIQE